jgi:hypothetical protein
VDSPGIPRWSYIITRLFKQRRGKQKSENHRVVITRKIQLAITDTIVGESVSSQDAGRGKKVDFPLGPLLEI